MKEILTRLEVDLHHQRPLYVVRPCWHGVDDACRRLLDGIFHHNIEVAAMVVQAV